MIRRRHHGASTLAAFIVLGALTQAGTAHADLTELKWATEGYFRTRTVMLTNLAPQPRRTSIYSPNGEEFVVPDIRRTSYIVSRLRLMPSLTYAKVAKLNFQIDALDDVLWGDNNGLSSAPLFATDGSNQGFLGGSPGDSVTIRRAWMQYSVPVGLMRVGRMPSHWGMGLLANGGGTGWLDPDSPKGEPKRKIADNFFDDDFGDNHFGSTADRILFVTRPITIYRTVKKLGKVEHPLIMGYAFDKLSESPLLSAEGFERKFRPFGQQGFISRGRSDDVNEHVVLAVWNDPDWDKKSFLDELKLGFYGVMRSAKEGSTNPSDPRLGDPAASCSVEMVARPCTDTGSKVYISDIWWRIRYGSLFTEGEAYAIFGETFGGVPFPSQNHKKKASINAGVARFAWMTPKWDAMLELGHASGDEDLGDTKFKQRAIHPDFNVGLILFEETLRELTARAYGVPFYSNQNPQGITGFMSNGGVINANYINPKGRFRPTPVAGLEIIGGILAAWVDTTTTGSVELFPSCEIGGACKGTKDAKYLGTEFDLAVRASFAGQMRFSLEAGYLLFGDALKHQLTEANSSFTLQSSIAFVW